MTASLLALTAIMVLVVAWLVRPPLNGPPWVGQRPVRTAAGS